MESSLLNAFSNLSLGIGLPSSDVAVLAVLMSFKDMSESRIPEGGQTINSENKLTGREDVLLRC